MKVLGWVLVGVAVVAALLSLDPAVVGLSETTPVLQLIALRGWLCLGAVAVGVVLLGVGGLLRRTGRKVRRLLVLGMVAVLVGLGHGGVLLERGTGTGEPLPAAGEAAIDVLTLNTQGTAAGVETIIALLREAEPDVVALQETPPDDAERIGEALTTDEVTWQVFTATTGPQPVQASALLVSSGLGEYQQAEAPGTTFAAVWARPVDGVGPELFSVHTVPPLPELVPTWRTELRTVAQLCDRIENVVVAGDLNATVDHATLRNAGCDAVAPGAGGAGTWPAQRPALLGAAIDHVLVQPDRWRATDARVLDVSGGDPGGRGDHRALLVRIEPVAEVR